MALEGREFTEKHHLNDAISDHRRHGVHVKTQRDLLEAIIGIIAGRESERGSNDQSVLHVKMRDDISPKNVVGRSLVCAGGSWMCVCVWKESALSS